MEAVHRLRAQLCRLDCRGKLRAEVDGDAGVEFGGHSPVDLGEFPWRGRRGGREFRRGREPAEELVVGYVDAIAKRFAAEDDLQRDHLDAIASTPFVG